MTSPIWDVQPGETLIREQIHGRFGGNPQAGISTSSTSPNVLVYSDHQKAAANGYDYDGWSADNTAYYYTGEGKIGDQVMARGNRAIAEQTANENSLRLFVAVGNQPGNTTRIQKYMGEFRTDPAFPYLTRIAPGIDGVPRMVFVFRLLPMGLVADDRSRKSSIDGASGAAAVDVVAVDVESLQAIKVESSKVETLVSGPVVQREAQLTERFQRYLELHGREVKRYRIVPVGLAPLYSDLADLTDNILYEAKGSHERMSVRLALGQVLDYGRFIDGARLAVLLPEAPAADLVELLEQHDVGCVVESQGDAFIDMTSLQRCP